MTTTWLEVPAPDGNLESIESAARELRAEAVALVGQRTRLTSAASQTLSSWEGAAAAGFAFKEKVAEESLHIVASSYDKAAAQTEAYAAAWSHAHSAATIAHGSINTAIDSYVHGARGALSDAVDAVSGFLSGAAGLLDDILPGDQSALIDFIHRLGAWSPPARRAELTLVGGTPSVLSAPTGVLDQVRDAAGWGVSHLLDSAGWVIDKVGDALSWVLGKLRALEESLAATVTAALQLAYEAINRLITLGVTVARVVGRVAVQILTATWKATVRAIEAVADFGIWLYQQAIQAAREVADFLRTLALDVLKKGLEEFLQYLHDHPWLQEALTRAMPWLVQAVAFAGSIRLLGPVAGPLLLLLGSRGKWPTTSYDDAVKGLQNLADQVGMLDDEANYSTYQDPNYHGSPGQLGDSETPVTDLLNYEDAAYDTVNGDPGIVVTPVIGPDGKTRYVVNIPGTDPDTRATHDGNLFDWTSNVSLMSDPDQAPTIVKAVTDAMLDAGLPPGAEVMLVGHSQGGIIAGYMAEHQTTFHVKAVVAAESPIARFKVPHDVQVAAIEHRQDFVPKLDGKDNPQASNWTTIVRDAPETPGVHGGGALTDAHSHYEQTALDAETRGQLDQFRQGAGDFIGSGTKTGDSIRVLIHQEK